MSAATKLSPSTLNLRLATLRKLTREMADNGLLDPGTASAIEPPGVKQQGVGQGTGCSENSERGRWRRLSAAALKTRCKSFIFSLLRVSNFEG